MTTLAIMTRLQLNWAEIPGIARAFTFTPTSPVDINDLPAVYPFQLGGMSDAVPNTGGEAGEYEVNRKYGYRVLFAPADMASADSGNIGSSVDANAVNIIDNALDYFIAHPRLHTGVLGSGQPEIGLLVRDATVLDGGVVTRPGPGGAMYRAADYVLTIGERRFPAAPFIS